MGSLPGAGLDEAHCLWPMCPHPCCWEAEQRILRGKPRMLRAQAPSRAAATASEVDGFPTLSVVNASEWPEGRTSHEVKLLFKSLQSEVDVSKGASSVLTSRGALPRGAGRHVNATSILLETNRENRTVKLSTTQISLLPSCTGASQSSEATVIWVPSSHYIPPCRAQNSTKTPQVAVQELICIPPAKLNTSGDKKKRLKQETWRERVPLQRTPLNRLSEERKGSPRSEADADLPDPGSERPGPDGDPRLEEAAASPRDHRLVPVDQTLGAAPEAEDGGAFHLRNKPAVFHPVWERIRRRHAPEDHPGYKYKLDTKTGVDGVDWESLKRQTYLWRKRVQAANQERGKPSFSEEEAGYLPDSLHPIPRPTLHYQSKSPPSIGPAKCRCMGCMSGVWQSYSRVLASQSKGRLFRNDAFKFRRAPRPRLNPGHQAVDEGEQSDAELDMKGVLPPPNSKQGSQETLLN